MAWPGFCNPRPLGLDLALEEIRTRRVGGARVRHRVSIGPTHEPHPPAPEVHEPAFKHIAEAELRQTVREREEDASKINQATSSLCGPAALMFLTGEHWPHRYSGFVIDLYETGTARLGNLLITPGTGCKNFDPTGKLAGADWVALAGIRDSENAIFHYSSDGDELAGITLPSGLAGWLEKAGFKNVVNDTNVYFTKGEANFREAARLHKEGYEVCLFIDAAGIQREPTTRGFFSQVFTCANHWVVLTSDISISSDSVQFTVFTWGERYRRVPHTAVGRKMTQAQWLQNYYGYVACKV